MSGNNDGFSTILEIADGNYALQNTYALDGRAGMYARSTRGHTASNCHLIVGEKEAVLLDTGFTLHRTAIRDQIAARLPLGVKLQIFPLRLQEPNSASNCMYLASQFPGAGFYGVLPRVDSWVNFQPDTELTMPGLELLRTTQGPIKTTVLGSPHALDLGGRTIDIFTAPIRTIATRWLYDRKTGTLFTSDMFSHLSQPTAAGPWRIDQIGTEESRAKLRTFLLGSRYWWLPGSDTAAILKPLRETFEQYDVRALAPTAGAVLIGRDIVRQQAGLLIELLEELGRPKIKPRYIPLQEVDAV